ncbi:MAG: metalloregulator ArsR/SmtB family transcription factor [Chloroflexota bacterium]
MMVTEENLNELLQFFKALSDINRLKIVGLLAQKPLSVEQIAEILNLHSSTVSHHLAQLAKAGLVKARVESYYNVYQLQIEELENSARRLLSQDSLQAFSQDADMDAYDRKVLQNYLTPQGKIKAFPSQQKKLEAILRHVINEFQLDQHYSEKEVNQILSRLTDDTAFLRRSLIDFGFMKRSSAGSEYWRVERD